MLESEQEWDDVKGSIGKIAMPYSAPDILETMDALIEIARAAQDLSDDIHEAFPEGLADGLGVLDVDGGYAILIRRLDDALKIAPDWIKRKESSNG